MLAYYQLLRKTQHGFDYRTHIGKIVILISNPDHILGIFSQLVSTGPFLNKISFKASDSRP